MKLAAWVSIMIAACLLQAEGRSFEEASIHPLSGPLRIGNELKISGTLVRLEGYDTISLVAEAYGVKEYQVSIEPARQSLYNVFYRIEARAGGQSVPSRADVRLMLQALLADRFHLKVHQETREMPVYVMVVDKNGPALKPSSGSGECVTSIGPLHPNDRNYRYRYSNCALDRLIDGLSNTVSADRPLLDQTGLKGRYDIEISATPERAARDASEPGDIRFLDAVRKLGLRIEARKAPVTMLHIDHVDSTPTSN
jgi:uncharacterized protein (TIGR03435 family)